MPSQVGYETADSEHETTGAPSAGGKSSLVVVVSTVSNCRQTTAFVIGEGGLLLALNDVQYAITRSHPDFVVVGEGRTLTYEMCEVAHRCIAAGAGLISTNADT